MKVRRVDYKMGKMIKFQDCSRAAMEIAASPETKERISVPRTSRTRRASALPLQGSL